MSQHEGFRSAHEQDTGMSGSVFHDDGSLNEVFLADTFGISTEEALQEVAFGSYNGTVAQMLGDEKCPVGATVSSAYADAGIQGVAEKFKALSAVDPRFSVRISEATMLREQVKKK